MRLSGVLLLFCVVAPTVVSQQPLRRSHPLSAGITFQRAASQDTVRVLALRVQFKADNDARTSGDGIFLSAGSPQQIDPPPHDAAYFTNKLRFLESYFRKTSNGKLEIRADLFGSVVTLADSMAAYSPPREGPNGPLARLVVDSWTAANALSPSFPFGQYDAFILFHAGVGRDIDLISIFGFDPTPSDLPSLTLNLPSMRDLLSNPSFQGVPVNNGNFFITNTMIIPETETRVFVSGSRRDTLQLSINGLLAASFGSFLGLPDLFDTNTGRSGIGQFGLMDGSSIFAYNGLFPPEPSAWEKITLGWTSPILVAPGLSTVSLPAGGLTTTGNDTIYKIPITEREYFLVENRSRDPLGNGQTITLVQNGSTVVRHYARDSIGFFFNDVSGIVGTLVDVEDFDWAISGDLTLQGFEGGGVLIWHIDETIIDASRADNAVNADPLRRGVDLEEADGSQDIGVAFQFLQPGSGTENGWPPDAWFSGNPAQGYGSVFNGTSIPSSRSNAGAETFISVRGFGPKAARTSVTIERGEGAFRPGALTRSINTTSVLPSPTVVSNAAFVPAGDRVYVFQRNGLSKLADSTGLLSLSGGSTPLAVLDSSVTFAVGVQDSALSIWRLVDATADGIYDTVSVTTVPVLAAITTPPMMIDSAGKTRILVGTETGRVWTIGLDGSLRPSAMLGTGRVNGLASSGTSDGSHVATVGGSLVTGGSSTSLGAPGPWLLAAGRSAGQTLIAVAEEGGTVTALFDAAGVERFRKTLSDTIGQVIIADADGDGRLDVVVSAQSFLYAFNEYGFVLDHYPKQLRSPNAFTGSPMVVDVTADGVPEVVSLTRDGTLMAYARDGRTVPSFPFQAAPQGTSSAFAFDAGSGILGFLVGGGSGALQAWESTNSSPSLAVQWSGLLNGARHSNFFDGTGLVSAPLSPRFFPSDRVYNWPNPAYGSTTQIRYYTSEPARISVKIFDLTGVSIAELNGDAPGGADGELTWDVTNIQSGIYLARVEASSSGKKEAVVIKIAVVK